MSSICFYFQVHQPLRVKRYRVFDVGQDHAYFNDEGESNLNNKKVLRKVAAKCYLPANDVFYALLKKYPEFKITFSLSGVYLDQLEEHAPEVLASFRRLVETGQVELLAETYYHSLAAIHSPKEFRRQVRMHRFKVFDNFGVFPEVFRNTELIYNNDIAREVERMGFRGILAEGADHILGWRSPNFLYESATRFPLPLLLKNYRLSDDIAFRFGERSWAQFPLTAPKFADWVSSINGNGEVVNLFMDYETFGEHQWADTGIFKFITALPQELLRHPDNDFVTPSEAIRRYIPRDTLDVPQYVSWADIERDLSAWMSNPMQHDALRAVYALEDSVLRSGDAGLVADWRRLQTSDHFYYMCTKWFHDGDVHAYFNPYESPYQAFIAYMNAMADMKFRLEQVPKRAAWSMVARIIRKFFMK